MSRDGLANYACALIVNVTLARKGQFARLPAAIGILSTNFTCFDCRCGLIFNRLEHLPRYFSPPTTHDSCEGWYHAIPPYDSENHLSGSRVFDGGGGLGCS